MVFFIYLFISMLLFNRAIGNHENHDFVSPVSTQYGDVFKYQGGKMLYDSVNVYVIFYGNWTLDHSTREQTTLLNFIGNVSSTPWFKQLQAYKDTDGHSVGALRLSAALTDSGSQGLALTDPAMYKKIVLDAVHSGYLSIDNQIDQNGLYLIMAGADVSDTDFCHTNCGQHGFSDEFQYMFIGYPGICSDRCIPTFNQNKSPNGSPAIDAAITIFSHEIQNFLTDPRGDGWVVQKNESNIELGDFCAGSGVAQQTWFGNVAHLDGQNGTYNLEVGDAKYLVQTIYNHEKKTCDLL
ncbi:phosphate-induced protein 1 [Phycomyces nitens]|nr:phosphate-induced protein 1 [Phycomyces nitens]